MSKHILVKVFVEGKDPKVIQHNLREFDLNNTFVGDRNSDSVDFYISESENPSSIINQLGRQFFKDNCLFIKTATHIVFKFTDEDVKASSGDHNRASMFAR